MFTYCIERVCSTLGIHQEKCCGSMQDMFLVMHDINEAILDLFSEEIMWKHLYQKTDLRFLV